MFPARGVLPVETTPTAGPKPVVGMVPALVVPALKNPVYLRPPAEARGPVMPKPIVPVEARFVGPVIVRPKKPAPVVFFKNFGNNALEFSLSFWIKVKHILDLRTVPSDIRFRIDELFREHGIVIAFPQNDLHFRTPLEVKLKDSTQQIPR